MKLPSRLFIFDIETIPDSEAAFNLTDCQSNNVVDQRNALKNYHLDITDGKNDFLRQPFHKVIAISYALCEIIYLSNGKETYVLKSLRSGGNTEAYCEKELIKGFFSFITSNVNPRIVTFNGRTFDIPVLKYRAMKYGISCKEFYDRTSGVNYQYRYNTDYNCDLLEVLSDFGCSARIKLHEVCSILGFPGKFGVSGKEVTPLYDEGNLKAIRDYCETDVLNTYLVYLRYSLHTGRIDRDNYNSAVNEIINFIDKNNTEHLLKFKEYWLIASKNNIFI